MKSILGANCYPTMSINLYLTEESFIFTIKLVGQHFFVQLTEHCTAHWLQLLKGGYENPITSKQRVN